MMLSTVNNPYRGGTNNNSNNNNSNHRMVIEDVTDDPEYSSYGNENEKPENEEEGAFVEYEKLDKTEDPAAYKVCQSTTAVNRTYNNIRPSYRVSIPIFSELWGFVVVFGFFVLKSFNRTEGKTD
ncbi:hypothetical protein CAEBREN_09847 [Caenorhabditis brenneri]|uniref:Uncharacterized protein n=1 Tax=Caenorhabditis brenneri TaxID=135651 RepID=G0P7J3_CAEBE|nr:hypothetical protein CAEBREN_09847 [Caenorhabditis brenneri]